MTPQQRYLARHALGINPGGRGGRNHFVTGPYDPDFELWTAMVEAGLATSRPYALCITDTVFWLTPPGEALARAELQDGSPMQPALPANFKRVEP